jgi:hypothetical protein
MPSLTFYASRFSSTPAPDAINEMLGRDLGEWLRARLEAAGYEVGDVIAEDYGYGFWLRLHGSHYWITQTQLDSSDSEMGSPPQWLVGVDYDPGCLWLWRLRLRPQRDDQTDIARAVYAILEQEPDISDLTWQEEGRTAS